MRSHHEPVLSAAAPSASRPYPMLYYVALSAIARATVWTAVGVVCLNQSDVSKQRSLSSALHASNRRVHKLRAAAVQRYIDVH